MAKKSAYSYTVETGVMNVTLRATKAIVETFDANDYPDTIRDKLFDYGLKQKIVDSASEGESPEQRLQMMIDCHERLLKGEWASEREGGARVVSVEVEALARIKDVSIAAIQKALASKDEDTRKKILTSAKVVEMAKKIREEREAAEELDLDDLEDESEE